MKISTFFKIICIPILESVPYFWWYVPRVWLPYTTNILVSIIFRRRSHFLEGIECRRCRFTTVQWRGSLSKNGPNSIHRPRTRGRTKTDPLNSIVSPLIILNVPYSPKKWSSNKSMYSYIQGYTGGGVAGPKGPSLLNPPFSRQPWRGGTPLTLPQTQVSGSPVSGIYLKWSNV